MMILLLKANSNIWFKPLSSVQEQERLINATEENLQKCTLHTFCDASKEAFAAVVFLRLEEDGSVKLSLLATKSRISPLRGSTVPRMELLAALVGARLTNSVIEALTWKEVKCYYWSDSTTVLFPRSFYVLNLDSLIKRVVMTPTVLFLAPPPLFCNMLRKTHATSFQALRLFLANRL
ncbi:hypothetical protein AVEN_189515-1 [Araneus ventricosus]|uniref:Uncharacterized protein n=1 Tax=Araneus ventricosus TaxID=182803 RepID=A0A4Y2QKQ6_ARAVE|nr:hypothetical protein AVEN_189515-1 [Araneus ventricosus]